ncbi:hypothetical protein L345_04111, partial [Ophiophagus hannah]
MLRQNNVKLGEATGILTDCNRTQYEGKNKSHHQLASILPKPTDHYCILHSILFSHPLPFSSLFVLGSVFHIATILQYLEADE